MKWSFTRVQPLGLVGAVVLALVLAGLGYALTDRIIGSTLEASPIYAQTADEQAASAVLGAPLPRLMWTPAQLIRSALTVDPEPEPIGDLPMIRFVYQSYSLYFENVALLKVNRGKLGAISGGDIVLASGSRITVPAPERIKLGDFDALVQQHELPDRTQLVSYYAERNGLVLELDVKLAAGLDRSIADRMFASIK